ncbi:MAG TPA: TetR/AcrR family transcriptional regulator, partial [Dongiaceae bacterium]
YSVKPDIRSPMASDTRTRMIETTARLLQHRGYHGASLNEILEASGAPRGSLYFHFPGGKEQLAIEATRAAVDEATQALAAVLAQSKTAAAGVRAYAEAAAQLMRESDYTFGCPVSPLILDASGGVAELAKLCRDAFETWTGMIAAALNAAGLPKARAASLALLSVTAIEGALLAARAYRDIKPLMTVGAELEAVLTAALPRRKRR